jgi:hypothetical protein
VVTINPEDTRGAAANVMWEAKTTRLSLRKILGELETAMENRNASVGIAVFGNCDTGFRDTYAEPLPGPDSMVVGIK